MYVDECSFSTNILPTRGYSERGKLIRSKTISNATHISGIATKFDNRIIGCQLFDGSVLSEDFGGFLIRVIENNSDIRNNLDIVCIYLD